MADAELIGRDRLHPPYAAFVSTGAARATQMLEILRHAAGQDQTPITVAPGLRSSVEDGSQLRQVVEGLPEGGRALVVGHSPTNEAAVLGVAGQVVPPLGKGEGIVLIEDGGCYRVEPLDQWQ